MCRGRGRGGYSQRCRAQRFEHAIFHSPGLPTAFFANKCVQIAGRLRLSSMYHRRHGPTATECQQRAAMGDDEFKVAVNESRQLVWTPQPVHALATRPDGQVVAVGRADGDIELAVPSEGYRVEARIPGQKNKGLRSLAWIEGTGGDGGGEGEGETEGGAAEADADAAEARLFGCGLDGTVFEVDLVRLCYKNVRDAYGGAAWCMQPAQSLALLAVGCEDGSIRLFSTEGGGVEYKRSFPSTGSRVLSLAWGPANDVIFAGCLDSMIHCLDAATGQALVRGRRRRSVWGGVIFVLCWFLWLLLVMKNGGR